MRWGKFVLLFQAIVTLIIGIVFLSSMIHISKNVTSDMIWSAGTVEQMEKTTTSFQDFSIRLEKGSYILLVLSAVELIIIMRLVG